MRENIDKSLAVNVVVDKVNPAIYMIQLISIQQDITSQSSAVSSKSNDSSDNKTSREKHPHRQQSDPLEDDEQGKSHF